MDITSTRMWQESVAIARELLNITDSDDGSSSGTDDWDGMRGKPAEKKVHACSLCDKTFTRAWVLKNHMDPNDKECTESSPILFDTPSNENDVETIDLIAEYIADTEPIQGSSAEAMDDYDIEVIVISSDADEEPHNINAAIDFMETEEEQKRKEEFLAVLGLILKPKNRKSAVKPEPKPIQRLTRSRMRILMQPFQNEREDSAKKVAPKRKPVPKKSVSKSKKTCKQSTN